MLRSRLFMVRKLLVVGVLGWVLPSCMPLPNNPNPGGSITDPVCHEEVVASRCAITTYDSCLRLREEDERYEIWFESDTFEDSSWRCIADSAIITHTPECCDMLERFVYDYLGCPPEDGDDYVCDD